MTLETLLFMAFVVGGLPISGLVAALLGWSSLRQPTPNWRRVGLAYLILAFPYALAGILLGGVGLALEYALATFGIISPLAAVGLTIGSVLRWRAQRP